jgi:hypothetical protein
MPGPVVIVGAVRGYGPQVVIQPSYGNPETRRHWSDTLDRAVAFREARYADVLTPEQRATLDAVHRDGTARFWGATDKHDRRMDRLTTGDVVVLTGQKHVRAVGKVGCGFRNHAFARRLWTPHPDRCLWSNVYSLLTYRPTWLRYEEIWALPGFNTGDNFMGLRFLSEGKGAELLGLLSAELAGHDSPS